MRSKDPEMAAPAKSKDYNVTRVSGTSHALVLKMQMPVNGSELSAVSLKWRCKSALRGGGKGTNFDSVKDIPASEWVDRARGERFVYHLEGLEPSTRYEFLMKATGMGASSAPSSFGAGH